MLSTSRILLLQCQLLLLEKGIKEYSADWLENTNTVMRDTGGRFANKAKTSIEETKNSAKSLAQGVEITSDTIQSLVKDKAFRERAGLATGLAAANVVKNVAALVKANPKVEAKIDQYITENQQRLSEIYGDDESPFGQALRKTDELQPPKDATFSQKLEFQVARYRALDEVIKSPEYANQEKEKQQELLGSVVKYLIPMMVSYAIALAPELLIPLLAEGVVDVNAALISATLGGFVDLGTSVVLDEAEIDDPVVRFVASLLSAGAAVGIVTGVKGTGRFILTEKQFGKWQNQKDFLIRQAKRFSPEFHHVDLPDNKKFFSAKFRPYDIKEGTSKFYTTVIDRKKYFVKETRIPPDGQKRSSASHEEAVFRIGELLGLGKRLLPIKKVVSYDSEYVISPFVQKTYNIENNTTDVFEKLIKRVNKEEVKLMTLFDFILNNSDRHAGNLFISKNKLLLIDHEFTLRPPIPYESTLRPFSPGAEDNLKDMGYLDPKGFFGMLIPPLSSGNPEYFSREMLQNVISKKDRILSILEDYKDLADLQTAKDIVEIQIKHLEKMLEIGDTKMINLFNNSLKKAASAATPMP